MSRSVWTAVALAPLSPTFQIDSLKIEPQISRQMKTPIPADAKRFQMRIMPPLIFMVVGGLLAGHIPGITMVLAKNGHNLRWMMILKIILFSIPVVLAFAFVIAWLLSVLLPTYTSVNGVHGHSFWYVRQFLNWSDIKQAKRFKLCNLAYVRLYSGKDSKVMWFPLYQKPSPEFQNEIRKFAPPGSPILEHLG